MKEILTARAQSVSKRTALAGWLENQSADDTMTHLHRGDLLALIGHAAQQQVQQEVCDFAKVNASQRSVL